MIADDVKAHFRQPKTVEFYVRAVSEVGLWRSEETMIARHFQREHTLVDLGSGAGRVAFGLWELGYRRVLGVDFSREMVAAARMLAAKLEYEVPFRVTDVAKLPFDVAVLDGAIFGWDGWMQIPGRDLRRAALNEIARVVRPGGKLLFTTPDRDEPDDTDFWASEQARWQRSEQDTRLLEFGDRLINSAGESDVYLHIPDRGEVLADLRSANWKIVEDLPRRELASEPREVTAVSTECRFWVAQRV